MIIFVFIHIFNKQKKIHQIIHCIIQQLYGDTNVFTYFSSLNLHESFSISR